ncbi:hypothetical protein CSUI_007806 [Cystoisospora suis]|uniref:Uncharacterized protein n=1 Tax=Cystoisospora suis TaxID=483139 RepID=A0A2C6JSN8_9APIC|nr:hypothetical protein CSUI_007806 [Cystoisospora suis]
MESSERHTTGYEDVALGLREETDSHSGLSRHERRSLFSLKNPHFLTAVCDELKRRDKQGTGLVTAATFSHALADMGLPFGSPEADLVMRYCQVTDDGYVVFKELMLATQSFKKQLTDHVSEAIAPSTVVERERLVPLPSPKTELTGFTPEITDAVRRLYAQWDRCCLRDWQFKEALQQMGLSSTPEFERLLAIHGPSGSVTFSQLMQALMMSDDEADNNSSRRSRRCQPEKTTIPSAADRQPFYEPRRNPVTWCEPQPLKGLPQPRYPPIEDSFSGNRVDSSLHDKFTRLKKLVALYLADRIPAARFRRELIQANVPITQEIDILIRGQEADNSGHFTSFVVAIFRAAERSEEFRQEWKGEEESDPTGGVITTALEILPTGGAIEREIAPPPPLSVEKTDYEPKTRLVPIDRTPWMADTSGSTTPGSRDEPPTIYPRPANEYATQHARLALANKMTASHSYYGHGDIISWGRSECSSTQR